METTRWRRLDEAARDNDAEADAEGTDASTRTTRS